MLERVRNFVSGLWRKAPTPEARAVLGPRTLDPLPLDQGYQRIGGSLTPADVSTIIRQADTGYIYRLVDLANESRQKDCHLQGVLNTRETALSGLDFNIDPAIKMGEDKPTDEDQEIALFVDSSIRNAQGRGEDSKSFADMVAHSQGAVYHGHAVSEIDWAYNGTNIVPAGFYLVSQRRFVFTQDEGRLEWWDQTRMTNSVPLQLAYPDRFIQHQPRINGDLPAREGLARVLIWAALFRNWTQSDWLKLAELAWKPFRTGTYDQSASTKDIADLERSLRYLTTNGVASFSDRTEFKVHWPEGGGGRPNHAVMAEFFAGEMSKATLGQTLTTQEGDRGARSLGEVHDRVRRDVRENDNSAASSTIRRDFIEPLVRLNYGPNVLIPGFEFITEDTPDLAPFAEGVAKLVSAGARIPSYWVADRAGYPVPSDVEEYLSGSPPGTGNQEDEEGQDDTAEPPKTEESDDDE